MTWTRFSLVLLGCCQVVAVVPDDEAVRQEFAKYVQEYQRDYKTKEEFGTRYEIFARNLRYIEEENAKGHSYKLSVNDFTDVDASEFAATHFGLISPVSDKLWKGVPYLGLHTYSGATLATAVDWTTKGAVTPVKNQGQCGSCWTFSSTGALEGAYKISSGKLVSLSEQQLVDCSHNGGDNGCSGGLMDNAFTYLENRSVCTEESYPYEAQDGTCHESKCTAGIPKGGVKGFKDVPHDDMNALMEAVAQQPVSIAIEADQAAFQSYQGGVLSKACGSALDHGVLLVGYGTDNGVDYWKVKNSWGASWGEQGYIRLERGGQAGQAGECGIKAQPSYPVMAAKSITKYARGYIRAPRNENEVPEVVTITEEQKRSAPTAVDWSTKGATSPVKNQGQCGSCWAFSTTEGVESAVFMATGKLPTPLSTQQIISCDSTDNGCSGGDPANALKYIESVGGLDAASDYPDTSHSSGQTGSCSWSKKEAAKVTSWKYAIKPCSSGSCTGQDEEALAAALAQYGPLSICVNAATWDSYTNGVFNQKCSGAASALDHCVQLVGYDKSGSAPFWKVRNSWGPSWGESGFIRLPFGKNACGVADEAYVITAAMSEATSTLII